MGKDLVDKLDIEILRFLCKNPKQSCREIAKHLDVSDRTVARRIARMENEGIIIGYQPVLNDYVKGLIYNVNDLTEVRFSLDEWSSFEGALREMYSTAADVILFHVGRGIGRSVSRNINIGKLSISDALTGLSKICSLRGWGNISLERFRDGSIKADLKHLRINSSIFRGILTSVVENFIREDFEVSSLMGDGSILVRIGEV